MDGVNNQGAGTPSLKPGFSKRPTTTKTKTATKKTATGKKTQTLPQTKSTPGLKSSVKLPPQTPLADRKVNRLSSASPKSTFNSAAGASETQKEVMQKITASTTIATALSLRQQLMQQPDMSPEELSMANDKILENFTATLSEDMKDTHKCSDLEDLKKELKNQLGDNEFNRLLGNSKHFRTASLKDKKSIFLLLQQNKKRLKKATSLPESGSIAELQRHTNQKYHQVVVSKSNRPSMLENLLETKAKQINQETSEDNLSKINQELSQALQEREDLHDNVQQKTDEIKLLQQEMARLRENQNPDNTDYQLEIKQLNNQIETDQETIEDLRQKLKNQQQDAEKAKDENPDTSQQLQEIKESYNKLQSEYQDQTNQLQDALSLLTEEQDNNTLKEDKITKQEQLNKNLKAQLDTIKQENDKKTQELESNTEEFNSLKRTMQEKINQLQATTQDQQAKLDIKDEKITELQNRDNNTTDNTSSLLKELEILQKEKNDLKQAGEKQAEKLAKNEQQIAELSTALNLQKETNHNLTQQLEALKTDNTALKQTINEQEEQLESLKKSSQSPEVPKEKEQQIIDLQAASQMKDAQIHQIQTELNDLKARETQNSQELSPTPTQKPAPQETATDLSEVSQMLQNITQLIHEMIQAQQTEPRTYTNKIPPINPETVLPSEPPQLLMAQNTAISEDTLSSLRQDDTTIATDTFQQAQIPTAQTQHIQTMQSQYQGDQKSKSNLLAQLLNVLKAIGRTLSGQEKNHHESTESSIEQPLSEDVTTTYPLSENRPYKQDNDDLILLLKHSTLISNQLADQLEKQHMKWKNPDLI